MMTQVIVPARADVVIREDVIESSIDPRPNAFYDQKTGILRVYHGPVYGNPFAMMMPPNANYLGAYTPQATPFSHGYLNQPIIFQNGLPIRQAATEGISYNGAAPTRAHDGTLGPKNSNSSSAASGPSGSNETGDTFEQASICVTCNKSKSSVTNKLNECSTNGEASVDGNNSRHQNSRSNNNISNKNVNFDVEKDSPVAHKKTTHDTGNKAFTNEWRNAKLNSEWETAATGTDGTPANPELETRGSNIGQATSNTGWYEPNKEMNNTLSNTGWETTNNNRNHTTTKASPKIEGNNSQENTPTDQERKKESKITSHPRPVDGRDQNCRCQLVSSQCSWA